MRIKRKINRAVSFMYNNLKTNDPFEICKILGIKIIFKNYNVDAMKGYMAKITDDDVIIYINSNLSKYSKSVILAHELGHVLLHNNAGNQFHGGDFDKEHEANLFTAYLLLDESQYDIKFENMNNYIMQNVIDELVY